MPKVRKHSVAEVLLVPEHSKSAKQVNLTIQVLRH